MARGIVINKNVEALIADVHFKHPYYGATKIRREVLKRLHDPNDQFYYQEYDDPDWPRVSAVQKKLSDIIQNEEKKPPNLKELDKPFSLGALVKHPILPETLPVVMRVWAQYLKQGDTLTIREALWFSRLSGVLSEFEKVGDKNWNLLNLVPYYAVRERAYEAIGVDIDPSDLDIIVLKLLKLIEWEPPPFTDYFLRKIRVITVNEDSNQPEDQKKEGGTS